MSPINAMFLLCVGLQAQRAIFPPAIYPGSRLTLAPLSSGAPQSVTATIRGRDYLLPLIAEKLPPAEESNPNPTSGPVYLIPRDLPLGPATIRYGDVVAQTEIGGEPPNHVYAIGESAFAYAQQQTGTGPLRRNRFTDPARAGDRITLWATGLDPSFAFPSALAYLQPEGSRQPDGRYVFVEYTQSYF